MPLRVFQDRDGQAWRVWFVMPAGVGVLGATFRDGWLCFERLDGSDRRRLAIAAAPAEWDTLSHEQLDALRDAAEPAQFSQSTRDAAKPAQRSGDAKRGDGKRSSPNPTIRRDEGTA